MKLPRIVEIVDVAPRDGLQNIPIILPPEAKVKLISGLMRAGIRRIEATSFVHPKWVPQLADAEQVFTHIQKLEGTKLMVLIPNKRGYARAKACSDINAIDEIALVVAASETMNRKNVNMSIETTLKQFRGICQHAKVDRTRVRGSIATSFGCPYEGKVAPGAVLKIAQELLEMGVDELMFADTIGCANPVQVNDLFSRVRDRWPHQSVAAHFHDTRSLALPNVLAALYAGVTIYDASVGGLGGCPFTPKAGGNVATEKLVFMMHEMGIETGIDFEMLLEVADFSRNLNAARPIQT